MTFSMFDVSIPLGVVLAAYLGVGVALVIGLVVRPPAENFSWNLVFVSWFVVSAVVLAGIVFGWWQPSP